MSKLWIYIIAHPLGAIIGWFLCGLIPNRYARLFMRSGVLAVALTPTVMTTASGKEIPISAVSSLFYDVITEPRAEIIIPIVWATLFLAGIVIELARKE